MRSADLGPLTLRAAVVHDWFQGYHGAERTADVMRRDLFAPGHEADVFTFHAAHELLPTELSRRSSESPAWRGFPASGNAGTRRVVGGTSCRTCLSTTGDSISIRTTS